MDLVSKQKSLRNSNSAGKTRTQGCERTTGKGGKSTSSCIHISRLVRGFPAILKGWIERVFTLGFAFSLTSEGWHGDIRGRIGLLKHEKALIINTTIFNQHAYQEGGLQEAMRRLIDEFTLQYPGIKTVDHEYFYAVNMADEMTLKGYLERAYLLEKDFAK